MANENGHGFAVNPARALAVFCALLLLSGCIGSGAGRGVPEGDGGESLHSNILRSDYVGSEACAKCHQRIFESFMRAPMHNMTRQAREAEIHAPFDGRAFRFKKDSVVLLEQNGEKMMRIVSPEFGDRLYRVTKVIGGHHREDFAGVEVGVTDTSAVRTLPVSYMLATGQFHYKGYSVMEPERPGLKPGSIWNRNCIFCHNTEPLFSTLLGELAGPSAQPYQGEIVDRLLPLERRWFLEVTDPAEMRRALANEIGYLRNAPVRAGQSLPKLTQTAVKTTRTWFMEKHLIEIGIGCESCHGGCREHALNPKVLPSFAPVSQFLKVKWPATFAGHERGQTQTRVCARCHQVLFTGYPWTWEGGKRSDPVPGGANINSGEARDLLLSNCKVTCTSCHDPHAADSRANIARLEGAAGNLVCLSCHSQFAAPEALRAHAHHDPAGAGGLCLNCHMPKKNMSLESKLSRYHRIGSPTDSARVEGDRPLECALCHAEKTVRTLVDTMEHWWPHRYNRGKLADLYGSLDANAIEATLDRGRSHEQAVALFLAGQARDKHLAPKVARELVNPYPLVRYYADNALAEMFGGPSPLDLHQANDSILEGAAAWLKKFGMAPLPSRTAGPAETAPEE